MQGQFRLLFIVPPCEPSPEVGRGDERHPLTPKQTAARKERQYEIVRAFMLEEECDEFADSLRATDIRAGVELCRIRESFAGTVI
jgi:hypothetical protein